MKAKQKSEKRDRKPDFNLEDVRGIRDRLSQMVNELNGLVQGMEKHPKAKELIVSVDGGSAIHDAELEVVKWVSRAKQDFQSRLIPGKEPTDSVAVPITKRRA